MMARRVLVGFAFVLLVYQAYTIPGWLADGPQQITANRTHGSTSWWAARVIEVLVLASVAGFVVHAVRERRREGRIGLDGLLIIGMFGSGFWDPIYNWTEPAWLYSSNWLNVNAWLDDAPGFGGDVNDQPWPVIIVLVGYPLWGVGFAVLINVAMRRARYPALIGLMTAIALTCTSFAVFRALDLMSAPGFRFSALGNNEILFAGFSGGIVFWGLALLREHARPLLTGGGTPTNILSSVAACQLLVIVGWGLLTVPFTPLSSEYPRDLPAHLTNGASAPRR